MGKRVASNGFTLIELLVVIAMIGILSSVLITKLDPFGQINKAKDAQRQHDLTQIKIALDAYYNDHNRYPNTLLELTYGNQPYIKTIPKDPSFATRADYQYIVDNSNSNSQWNVLLAALAKVPATATACPLTVLTDCLPRKFNASWMCTLSGKVDCSIIKSYTLPVIEGAPQ